MARMGQKLRIHPETAAAVAIGYALAALGRPRLPTKAEAERDSAELFARIGELRAAGAELKPALTQARQERHEVNVRGELVWNKLYGLSLDK